MLSHSNSFGNDAEKGPAGCRALNRKSIVIGGILMAQTKNLCARIPTALHAQVCEAREQSGLTTAQYITNLLLEYYEMKENGEKTTMANNSRTMAFQIPEEKSECYHLSSYQHLL